MPFALEAAGNPSVSCRREYSGINALLVEPSQDALANHSYAVTLRLSRFEIDSVDSVPHVDKFMLPSEPHKRPIGREPQSIRLGTYLGLLTILNNSLLRTQLWDLRHLGNYFVDWDSFAACTSALAKLSTFLSTTKAVTASLSAC